MAIAPHRDGAGREPEVGSHATPAASRWLAAAAAAVGALALAGWVAGVPALRTFVPGWASLKANTALLLLALAAGIAALPPARAGHVTALRAVATCAWVALALAGSTLAEHLLDLDLGVDEALFVDAESAASGHAPGRPAAATALNALLQAGALLLAARRSRRAADLGQWLAAVAAMLALVAVAGFTYGLDTLYTEGLYATAAPHTSVTLLALALGHMLATPEGALTRLYWAGTRGARLVLRRLLPVALLVPWIAGLVGLRVADATKESVPLAIALVASASMLALGGTTLALAALVARREDELSVTLRSIGDGVIAVDAAGLVTELNPVAAGLTGWSRRSALGRALADVFEIVNEETRAPAVSPVGRVLQEGIVVGLANHTVLISRDGTERAIADSCAPVRDDTGALLGAVLVFRDQTQERAAAAAEARARAELDCAPLSIALLDAGGRVTHVNAAWREFALANGGSAALGAGTELDYLDACRAAAAAGDAVAARVVRELGEILAGRSERLELDYACHAPTARRWFHLEARALGNGEPGAVVMHADTTARHLAEMRLRVQDSVARALARRAACGEVCRELVEATCNTLEWDVGELWLGGPVGPRLEHRWLRPGLGLEAFGEAGRRLEPPACQESSAPLGPRAAALGWIDEDPAFPRREAAAAAGLRTGFSVHVRCSGARACLAFFSRIGEEPDPALLALFESLAAQIDEVSQRAEAEAALATSEERFRLLFESSSDALLLVDDRGLFDANRAAARMFGCASREELLGPAPAAAASAREAAGEDPATMVTRERAAALHDGPRSFEWVGRRRDTGAAFPAEVDVVAVRSAGRSVAQVSVRDLTVKRALLGELVQMERLASMGALAAGVGHEINNPLAAVIGNLEVALEEWASAGPEQPPAPAVGEALRDAREAAERVRAISRDLRVYARAEQDQVVAVDLRRVLDSTLRMAAPEIRRRARVVVDYGDTPLVAGTEARLGQVFLNLVLNAAHAIPEGLPAEHEIRVVARRDADGRAVVEIRDTGCGMSADVRARLFEPFFTTKPAGVGTGLGLPIVQRIVSELGGTVEVTSEVGRGTTFAVRLPSAPALAPPKPASIRPLRRRTRRARVLIVDDEPMLCKLMARVLGGDHDVETTTRAEEALARIEAGERFDAIVCDLTLPGMSGADLHAKVTALAGDQAARMIFVTGGAFAPEARSFLERTTNPRLDKPVDPEKLRAAVGALLS